jgi:hypothetical protein
MRVKTDQSSPLHFTPDISISLQTEVQNNILLSEFYEKIIKYRPCLCALAKKKKLKEKGFVPYKPPLKFLPMQPSS